MLNQITDLKDLADQQIESTHVLGASTTNAYTKVLLKFKSHSFAILEVSEYTTWEGQVEHVFGLNMRVSKDFLYYSGKIYGLIGDAEYQALYKERTHNQLKAEAEQRVRQLNSLEQLLTDYKDAPELKEIIKRVGLVGSATNV